ncbi:MAG: hypothetical protein EXQ67_08915 [Thermoleophilia bacterium]|nr:hypothetical protein [Thermoleophilia bacterium]
MATATTTQEIDMTTTQKAPTTIFTMDDLDVKARAIYGGNAVGMHGYCTVNFSNSHDILFDVYCQIDGDEILMRCNLRNRDACAFINYANNAIHNGEEV